MAQDKVSSNDWVNVGVGSHSEPGFPCPQCGKESKEHHPDEQERPHRICSAPTCRFEGLASLFFGLRN